MSVKLIDGKLSKGFDGLQAQLYWLSRGGFEKEIRAALKRATLRVREIMDQKLSGAGGVDLNERTGVTRRAFAKSKLKFYRRRGYIKVGLELPRRNELGIAQDDLHYYPMALEYGTPTIRPRAFIRRSIDDHFNELVGMITKDLEVAVRKSWGKIDTSNTGLTRR